MEEEEEGGVPERKAGFLGGIKVSLHFSSSECSLITCTEVPRSLENAHPLRTPFKPLAWAYGRVLGRCIFFSVRYPCTRLAWPRNMPPRWNLWQLGSGAILQHYMGTSLIRKRLALGIYNKTRLISLCWSRGKGRFLMSEVPLYVLQARLVPHRPPVGM